MTDTAMSPFKAKLLQECAESFSYELGNAAFVHGRLDEANVLFRRALDVNPRNAKALGHLSLVLEQLGDRAAAQDVRRKADEAEPNWRAAAEFDRGRVYEALGRQADAIASFRKTVDLDPSHIKAIGRIFEHQMLEEPDARIIAIYRKIAQLDRQFLMNRHRLFIVPYLMLEDDFAESALLTEEILSDDPADANALIYRAMALSFLERHEEAIRVSGTLLGMAAGEVYAIKAMARCLVAAGRAAEALAFIEPHAAVSQHYWIIVSHAQALAANGRVEEAMARYQAASEVDNGVLSAGVDLAVLLDGQGRPLEALERYDSVLRNTTDEQWQLWVPILRGSSLEALGRNAEATAGYLAGLSPRLRMGWAYQFVGDRNAVHRKLARARQAVAGNGA